MVIFLPVLKVAEIKSRMESGALFAIITLTAVASSGLNLFDSISFSENMISTKEIRNSFRRIVERVNTGIDLRGSLLLESELVPSKTFSMLYEGLSSISMSGVGLSDFLEGFLWDLLNAMEGKVRSAIDRLGVLVESYIIVAVIFPFMLVLMMLMAGGSWGLLGGVSQTLLLFDVGLLPPVFAILILLADMILREVMLD
jgi:archaellum biogenesis protein FlaJ (TadC family)